MGQAPSGLHRIRGWHHHIRVAATQGTRTREQGTVQGQRDFQTGQHGFRTGGARPPLDVLRKFFDQHCHTCGIDPICKVLQIVPTGYWRHASHPFNHPLSCAPVRRGETLISGIERVWQANNQVYRADRVWKQMKREGFCVASCKMERLMKRLDLHG